MRIGIVLVVLCQFTVGGALQSCGEDAANTVPPSSVESLHQHGGLFEREIAPLLAYRCLSCHQGADARGGLDLSTQRGAAQGGESGVAIVPGQRDESLLWERVRDGEMPPDHPLQAHEQKLLSDWIAGGAKWTLETIDPLKHGGKYRAGFDWWSLQPVVKPDLPSLPTRSDSEWCRNEIDRFVRVQLSAQGLEPSPEANRKTLIRRLSFDLVGLPPTPQEVEDFIKDHRPDAYEQLVERLLSSPQYGVRWGRHWLDLARFGESQGFERDKLRENSWPYRDWVVDALNRDLPYDQFARMQIAGDILGAADLALVTARSTAAGSGRPSGDSLAVPERTGQHVGVNDSVVATGFLVAGPYDEVGQSQQSAVMKAVVRQDEMEDYVSVVGQTFLGLTVHCARCHDHKFDPIRQTEYYQLAAALDGVSPGNQSVKLAAHEHRLAELEPQIRATRGEIDKLVATGNSRLLESRGIPDDSQGDAIETSLPIARWNFSQGAKDRIGEMNGSLWEGAALQDGRLKVDGKGYATTTQIDRNIREKTLVAWVQLNDLDQRGGGVISLQTLDGVTFDAIVIGEKEPRHWMAGSNGFSRTQSFGGIAEEEANKGPVQIAITYQLDGTITGYRQGELYGKPYKSSPPIEFEKGKAQVVFGLRHSPAAPGRMLSGGIVAAELYDRALSAEAIRELSKRKVSEEVSRDELLAVFSDLERKQFVDLESRLQPLLKEREALTPISTYAVKSKPAGSVRLLLRGNPGTPGEVVSPGGVQALQGGKVDFLLKPSASDTERRRALANWVTDPGNPLFARVMVNRVWHWHFGQGFIRTPSDFGFNGGTPTHPELLDWLASTFVQQGFRLKPLHRLIVTSATYRQQSLARDEAVAIDAGNRWLWRMSPRRLDAEEIRDATLAVAGEINLELGGPGYRDFETYVHNTQFYKMTDPVGTEFNRRTIYRTWVRSGRNSLLDVFDCPDPSTMSPQRSSTVTPLQALAMQNNSFVLRMSAHLASRVEAETESTPAAQADRAFQHVCQRPATEEEVARVVPFIKTHGLTEFCRVLLNSNEFLHLD